MSEVRSANRWSLMALAAALATPWAAGAASYDQIEEGESYLENMEYMVRLGAAWSSPDSDSYSFANGSSLEVDNDGPVVAGDIREHVIPVLTDTLNLIKAHGTKKIEHK